MSDNYNEDLAIIHTAAELIKTSPDPQHAMGRAAERARIVAYLLRAAAWNDGVVRNALIFLAAEIEKGSYNNPANEK